MTVNHSSLNLRVVAMGPMLKGASAEMARPRSHQGGNGGEESTIEIDPTRTHAHRDVRCDDREYDLSEGQKAMCC